ncbi:menaquinol-cytochrome c reductase cytochrome b subunit precursor [Motilibacter rhizosphaerae]|uniref:Cytochrome bc1 complex cytochrome b subunit n=1 Tax=Motilibacter rhizosphaerae TaxID=598652 RepID=A0A4Q7NR89_9ACTN|nr:cytochrome bc complex cytochrome b subunit [Motilibacter rhizosphaerae]RZS89551.1 menaquinol-cytochrome c reductase cytochrome b subunit precursor [Motilibacter rhizosphaerae]
MSTINTAAGAAGRYLDDRLGVAKVARKNIRKIFPDHWSFMLGEITLYSFIILLLTGTWLTLFFTPSMNEVIYNGPYTPLKGLAMSEAYRSTLEISFEIRGGLIMRHLHHWAALVFIAGMAVHAFRTFFTGAFRKPRELNWLLGIGLLVLGLLEGFFGYSLPDDLLSGTGLRIADGVIKSIPVVGTYVSFFFFGGEFPGVDLIPRMYMIHILLVPALILGLIGAHVGLVTYHKHTQYPGAGRTDQNVVGYPLLPVYMAKAGGFFFVVFGVLAAISTVAPINPVWQYGPYNPSQVSAGSQPDWYIGFLEGSLRMMPNLETRAFGHTVSWNVLIPSLVIPGIFFTVFALYPFLEAWVTGDKREHHVLDRPRNVPVRTALGVVFITEYAILWIAGGNDIIAVAFGLSINAITWTFRVLFFVAPPLVFVITKRACLGLQRRDREKVLHGRETGILMQLPHGEFVEVHEPISAEERWKLVQHEVHHPVALPSQTDRNGVKRRGVVALKARSKVSSWFFEDQIEPPTPAEVRELEAGHAGH